MSRRMIPGLEAPDPALEREIRARLDEVESALKAVRADSDMLAETAQWLLAAGGKRFRPMLVLLSGYFGQSDRRWSGFGLDRARPPGDALLRRRDRRGGRTPRRARRRTPAGATRSRSSRATTCSPRPPRSRPSWGPTSARSSPARSRRSATARSARSGGRGRIEQSETGYLDIIRRKTGALIATSCGWAGCCRMRPGCPRRARAVRGSARPRVPALRRHHGPHGQPADPGQGAGTGHAGGRLHAPGPARARRITGSGSGQSCRTGRRAGTGWTEPWRSSECPTTWGAPVRRWSRGRPCSRADRTAPLGAGPNRTRPARRFWPPAAAPKS